MDLLQSRRACHLPLCLEALPEVGAAPLFRPLAFVRPPSTLSQRLAASTSFVASVARFFLLLAPSRISMPLLQDPMQNLPAGNGRTM